VQRDLAGLGASATWALVSCLAVGGVLGVVAVRDATWGGPLFSPMAVGLLTLLAGSAVGFVAGILAPSRFAPPLIAVGIFVALAVPTAAPYERSSETGILVPSHIHYLTPLAITEQVAYPVFLEPWPDIAGQQAIWLVGIGGVALFGLALVRRASPVNWAGFVLALATAGVGLASLLTVDFRVGAEIPYVPALHRAPGERRGVPPPGLRVGARPHGGRGRCRHGAPCRRPRRAAPHRAGGRPWLLGGRRRHLRGRDDADLSDRGR
jgi:hypothetical protein